jgi:23S rRNA (uracil1939-C5)-methyltransferase
VTYTVAIESIAAGGDGVGHIEDGLVVFVPRAAPGDILDIEITQRKKRYARGAVISIQAPGVGRVEPRCIHYDAEQCGGCQLQHLGAAAQREAKRKIVGDTMRRIAKLDIADPEIVASPKQWRYRGKVTLAAKHGHIGFRKLNQPAGVFDLNDCLLANERIMELWRLVSANRRLLPEMLESVVLKEDRAQGLHLVSIGGDRAWNAEPMAEAIESNEVSYWWKPEQGAARVVCGARTGYPAVAFEQVNLELADTIRQAAVDGLGALEGKVVWDLYGGIGDTAEILASRGAIVWSVDSDRSAIEWGAERASRERESGLSVTRINDRVEEVVHRLPPPESVVVNPPRFGLSVPLASWLQRWGESVNGARLAYISCDPATLARDIARMPDFGLRKLVSYDLFPQTGHVETLAVLEAA